MSVPEDYTKLVETLQKMKVNPKADNPEDFMEWAKSFVKEESKVEVKQEPMQGATSKPYIQLPRINTFSGSHDKKAGEVPYELWKYEIQGLMKDNIHSEEVIAQAVRRSLRGEAGLIAMRLGPEASVPELMLRMENIFGNIDDLETIMSDFYGARQKDEEDVSQWSCRLESILDKATQTNKVEKTKSDAMLHDMIWKGLRTDLKDISHYEKEKYQSYDKLLRALRRIEKEQKLDHPPKATLKATSKQAVHEESELTGVLKQINVRLEKLEQGKSTSYQHQRQQQHDLPQQQQQYQFRPQFRGRGQCSGYRGRGSGYGRGFGQTQQQQQAQQQQSTRYRFPPVTCNRCGRDWHIAKGCRAVTDVNGKRLN